LIMVLIYTNGGLVKLSIFIIFYIYQIVNTQSFIYLSSRNPLSLQNTIYSIMKSHQCNNIKTADIFSLDSIRSSLIRQEETIIFALIERSQFRRNDIVYKSGEFDGLHWSPSTLSTEEPPSFLQYMIMGTEYLHGSVRRYTSPEEHSFFPAYHKILHSLPSLEYPELLSTVNKAYDLNYNLILFKHYISSILPSITKNGDDEQHGSTVLADIAVLQALSRRVHYGKFVAELKYKADSLKYNTLVHKSDANGVRNLLTNSTIERKVIKRAGMKAFMYGQEVNEYGFVTVDEKNTNQKIDPSVIERIYREFIIPLTKDIEVEYLFKRCGNILPVDYVAEIV